MFDKNTATQINTKNAEPRWISNGEKSVEGVTNRPLYDINLKHSFIDAEVFNYRAREIAKTMTFSGFIDEIKLDSLLDFSIDNKIKFKTESTFNYKGIVCTITEGTEVALSKPLELVTDITIDMLTDGVDFDMSHSAGDYVLTATHETNPWSGKLYKVLKNVQIADNLDVAVLQGADGLSPDVEEVLDPTFQDLVVIKVVDYDVTMGSGNVYLHGNRHNPAISYADMSDQERVDFFNANNNIRVQQDHIIQTQFEFVVTSRYTSDTDILAEFGYVQDTEDKGIYTLEGVNYINMFTVNRRNNALHDISFNPKGSKQSVSGEWFNRVGDETPLDAWGLWHGNVISMIENIPTGFYPDSTLVSRAFKVDDRDIQDNRMYSRKLEDPKKYLIERIKADDIRGSGYYKESNLYDVTISQVYAVSSTSTAYLGHRSYEIITSGSMTMLNEIGKLLTDEKAFITDDNGVNHEIYAIRNSRMYTVPQAVAIPTNPLDDIVDVTIPFSAGVYQLVVQTNSNRQTNNERFVTEVLGDKNLLPTGTTFLKQCVVTQTVDETAFVIFNNSMYPIPFTVNERYYFVYNGIYRSFIATSNSVLAPNGGEMTIFVGATIPAKKQVHNWYQDFIEIEFADRNLKYNTNQVVEGNRQFITLNYLYVDGLRVIKSNDAGMSWTELNGLVMDTEKNGFVLDTEVGYIYAIMYNGKVPYSQGHTPITERALIDHTDIVMTNSTRYKNLFMSTIGKCPEVDSADTFHTSLKVKKDGKSVNEVIHYEANTDDFDYRASIIKTFGSVYGAGDRLYGGVDFNEFSSYTLDKEIKNPGVAGNLFGYAIDIAQNVKRMAISAPQGSLGAYGIGRGLVYIMDFNEATHDWDVIHTISIPEITPIGATHFGTSVSLSEDGTRLVVGQGAQYTPNDSNIFTYEITDTTVTQNLVVLNKNTKLIDNSTYMFGNSDNSITNWSGIGYSVELLDNGNYLAIGLPGYDGSAVNIGRVVLCERHSTSGQWSEAIIGGGNTNLDNPTVFIESQGVISGEFGRTMTTDYVHKVLYVGGVNITPTAIDISTITAPIAKAVTGGLFQETVYDDITVSKDGTYFVYSKGRDLTIKRLDLSTGTVYTGDWSVYRTYTRDTNIAPATMTFAGGIYMDGNDNIISAYNDGLSSLVNGVLVGGNGKVIYYQPNDLDSNLYTHVNTDNLSSDITFVRNGAKFKLITEYGQSRLLKNGSIQIDLKHFFQN